MLYFANPSTQPVRDAMTAGLLGCISQPGQRNPLPDGVTWCADNGCFGAFYQGHQRWYAWLVGKAHLAGTCRFATAPDVVGDAVATLALGVTWLPMIRALGFPAALVAQDGLEALTVPWDSFDVLFIGGTTDWKLGAGAAGLAAEAVRRGKAVHLGRVSSLKRLKLALRLGCDSCDGTYIRYAPDINLARMLRFIDQAHQEHRP